MKEWRQQFVATQRDLVKLLGIMNDVVMKAATFPNGHTQAVDEVRESLLGWCSVGSLESNPQGHARKPYNI
eukprot:12916831-Prorocentrum_lima.AAC.1